jgi:hypothetical protein
MLLRVFICNFKDRKTKPITAQRKKRTDRMNEQAHGLLKKFHYYTFSKTHSSTALIMLH